MVARFRAFSVMLTAVSMCAAPQAAAVVPWFKDQGEGEVLSTTRYYSADKHFNSKGKRRSIPNDGYYSRLSEEFYLEVGLADQLVLFTRAELLRLKTRDEVRGTDRNSGLADPELGLRFRIRKPERGHLAVGMQGSLTLPSPISDDDHPRLDNRSTDLDVRVLLGGDYRRGWWTVSLGPKLRFGDPADEFNAYAGVSVDLVKPDLAIVNETWLTYGFRNESGEDRRIGSDRVVTLEDTDDDGILDTTVFTDTGRVGNIERTTDYDRLRHQISLLYRVNDTFYFQGGYYKDLWGRNTGAGEGLLVSFWLNW